MSYDVTVTVNFDDYNVERWHLIQRTRLQNMGLLAMPAHTYSRLERGLREACEIGFKVGPPYDGKGWPARAPTGEEYTELHIPLESDRKGYYSAEGAFAAAIDAFKEYAKGKTGTLYWRIYPELTECEENGWRYYMRLLISDKVA